MGVRRTPGPIERAARAELRGAARTRTTLGTWALTLARAMDGPEHPSLDVVCPSCACEHEVQVPGPDGRSLAVMGRELRMTIKAAMSPEAAGDDEPDVADYGVPQ